MSHPVADVLRNTRALVEIGWCQHASAMKADDEPCSPDNTKALRWCMAGAIHHVTRHDPFKIFYARTVLQQTIMCGIEGWNDAPGRTKEQVLMALESAAVEAEKLTPNELASVPMLWRAMTGCTMTVIVEAPQAEIPELALA